MRKVTFMDIPTGSWEYANDMVNDFISVNEHVLVDVKMESLKLGCEGYKTVLMVLYESD